MRAKLSLVSVAAPRKTKGGSTPLRSGRHDILLESGYTNMGTRSKGPYP